MASEHPPVRFLLDEHYPGWLADDLAAGGVDAVALNLHRPELHGADDKRVLEVAAAEGRVVVTEDVTSAPSGVAISAGPLPSRRRVLPPCPLPADQARPEQALARLPHRAGGGIRPARVLASSP